MKTILLTNFRIKEFTGSELDTITIANYFLNNNYKVDIFTIESGNPLMNKVSKKIRIITPDKVDKLRKQYDLIWVHHYPLLDYILFTMKIEANYVNYFCLSFFEPIESLPFYYNRLNNVNILSEKAKDKLVEQGFESEKMNLFPNYATLSYFENRKNTLSKKIEKVCVVSNHVPNEITDLKNILNEQNIQCDIYGKQYIYKEITFKVLKQYDLIISIGKTINYALALGIPCYCYDHFGGDGYITKSNIKASFYDNFSGRTFHIKKTGQELYDDIFQNYENTLQSIDYTNEFAFSNLCLEKNIERVLKENFESKKFDLRKLLNDYPTYEKKSSLYVKDIYNKTILNYSDNKQDLIKIYFNNNGYKESNCVTKSYILDKNEIKIEIEIKIPNNAQELRIDFAEKEFIALSEIQINDTFLDKNNILYFNTFTYNQDNVSYNCDPYVIIKQDLKKNQDLKINLKVTKYDIIDLVNRYNNLLNESVLIKAEIAKYKNNIFNKVINKLKK